MQKGKNDTNIRIFCSIPFRLQVRFILLYCCHQRQKNEVLSNSRGNRVLSCSGIASVEFLAAAKKPKRSAPIRIVQYFQEWRTESFTTCAIVKHNKCTIFIVLSLVVECYLSPHFGHLTAKVVECPNLSQRPFYLGRSGMSQIFGKIFRYLR